MVGRLVTVGVYGFAVEGFLTALRRADVGVLLDVRQRRGVRGSEYAWANSQRLQQALAECGIGYRHLKELAPTSEIRAAQYAADATLGEGKRTRTELSDSFKRAYVEQILEPIDLNKLLEEFVASSDSRYVFHAEGGRRRIRYVGVAEATARIEPGTLVRVSLARAWAPSNAPAGLYLQISGWYVG